MNITRAAGRSMLASFFVVNGSKAAANPEAMVSDAEPIARKVVPLVQQVAPPSVANYVPDDTRTLVRVTGIAQVLGGLGLATGLLRRPAAAVLSASMVPHVLASRAPRGASAEEKTAARSVMLRNVALLGGALIASQDTQGKPSVAWRASSEARHLSRAADKQRKAIAKAASSQADAITGSGTGRKAKKQLKAQAKVARKELKAQSKIARKQAHRLGKQAHQQYGQLSDQVAQQVEQFRG